MSNPLLSLTFDLPFDRIKADHVVPALDQLISDAQAQIERIANSEEVRTYANTLAALEDATEPLELALTVVGHLESVATTPELRAAYNEARPKASEFFASIPMHAALYKALKDFEQTDEAKGLTGARKRFLVKTLDDFRRHGAELNEEDKQRLMVISRELAETTMKFSQNVLDATNAYELFVEDEARLEGLPESAKAAARSSAEAKGKTGYRFTLQAPSVIPLLTYLSDASIREAVWRAFNQRAANAPHDNRPLLQNILSLRAEKAALLGFEDFADLVLEDRMAKTGKKAHTFVDDLTARVHPAFERENIELADYRTELEGDSASALQPWDVSYYAEKLRRERFGLDEEQLRPYFPVDRVLDGLFKTAERLYGVTIEAATAPVWHEAVRTYDIRSAEGKHIARFYADLFPRESKRDGAWMNGLMLQTDAQPHLGLFCANINPPVGNAPALPTHREVETLFHEFGHLLHHAFSKVSVRSLGGTNVAWDFVELPSQIMENWCWEREALDLFTAHHETSERMPDALYQKMLRARTFRAANFLVRQLGFAQVDLCLHRRYKPAEDGDVMDYARAIARKHSPAELPDDYAMITSFGHLFSSSVGYAAGYYSYLWAQVLEADAFTRFKQAGAFDPEAGRAFKEAILERGDSEEPMELYKRFMHREPKLDALLERSGLARTA